MSQRLLTRLLANVTIPSCWSYTFFGRACIISSQCQIRMRQKGNLLERTLIIVKPDAVQRGLTGEIIKRFEARGLKIIGMKLMQIDRALAEKHYDVHRERPFFGGLVEYIISAPVVVMALEGTDAIAAARATIGATKPSEAAPGSIRGDYGLEIGRNLVHGSDSVENGEIEVANFFDEALLCGGWSRDVDRWVFE